MRGPVSFSALLPRAALIHRSSQLPALVRPGPVGGGVVDLLLDEPRVTLREGAGGQDLSRFGERLDPHLVRAGSGAAHGDEETREARDAGYLLRTQVESRVAIQKPGPVLVLAGGRLLIGDHGYGAHDVPALDDVGEQLFRRHESRAEARAQLLHLALRPVIDQWLVGGVERVAELERQREQHPLPVALMRAHEQHRLALLELSARALEVHDAHAAADLLPGQARALDDLDQHLREAEIVAAHHRAQLRLVEVREGARQVAAHQALAVREDEIGRASCRERGYIAAAGGSRRMKCGTSARSAY